MAKDYAAQRGEILKNLDGIEIEVDTAKKVGTLWFNRPPLNVVSYRGRFQINAIMEAFSADPDVRVIVIRGRNDVYTSGGDVKAFPDIELDGMSDLAWNIASPSRSPKPVVCLLEKYAMGVGFELAMACDIRLATKGTLLALPEVTLGQIPGSGGSQRVARLGTQRGLGHAVVGKSVVGHDGHNSAACNARRVGGLLLPVAPPNRALDVFT